jgi:hypothetical protein
MAFADVDPNGGGARPSGVRISITPTAGYFAVIRRAPDVSGGPGTFADIARTEISVGAEIVVIDPLPVTGTVYWYAAYQVNATSSNGPTTTPQSSVARLLL